MTHGVRGARAATPAVRRAAVLGHPIEHSLSPVLHRAAYAALGLDGWEYDARDVTEDRLPAVVAGLDDTWAGLSLTMPLKTAVLPLLDHVEPLAEVVGAVNTVLVERGGSRPTLAGANTDVHGIVAALHEGLGEGSLGRGGGGADAGVVADAVVKPVRDAVVKPVRDAVVIGAGATAASTLAALAQLGCPTPQVFVRSMGRAGSTMRAASRMGVEPRFQAIGGGEAMLAALARADVVVSTLPPRAADPWAQRLPDEVRGVLLDCAYDPRPTMIGAAWAAAGGVVIGGERMLLHQATEQVRLMTGRAAPTEAMDAALQESLGARSVD